MVDATLGVIGNRDCMRGKAVSAGLNSCKGVFSVLTPTGRGAVAVVVLEGAHAEQTVEKYFCARNRQTLKEQPIGRIVYGHWGDEDLIVCRRDLETIEIHCHGGSQSVATISRDLSATGCVEITWQEWLSRQDDCPLRTAAQMALANAVSKRAAAILLDQFHGALRTELLGILSLVRSEREEAVTRLENLLATAPLGVHLTQPWQVVIAGKPNVGKSSLINALVGYRRAIVFDQPGTTRDVVTASTVIDGWPVALSDTAGLHAATDELESAGIKLARERLSSADLVVWVLEATQLSTDNGRLEVDQQVRELGLALLRQQLVVLNKIDLKSSLKIPDSAIATCAISGIGVSTLLTSISNKLVPQVPPAGLAVLFTTEQESAVASALATCQRGGWNEAAVLMRGLLSVYCGE